jgi:hypothetical protein
MGRRILAVPKGTEDMDKNNIPILRAVYGPCPPKAIFGPAFTPGSGNGPLIRKSVVRGRPFTVVLDVVGL